MRNLFVLVYSLIMCVNANAGQIFTEQKQSIGPFNSRAVVRTLQDGRLHPTVILIPGSGAHGPDENMPASVTEDGKDTKLFDSLATALNAAGLNTIALGKPGVEFFSGWDPGRWFYDQEMYRKLHWSDLIKNLTAAVEFARQQPGVDPKRIYILGHSEGTQVAIDYAATEPGIKGLLLLGYMGADLATIVDWQLYRRIIDFLIVTDIDQNKDGFVDKLEAELWPSFTWSWRPEQSRISYADIVAAMRANPGLIEVETEVAKSPLYAKGIYDRGEIHIKAALLKQDVYVFQGALDMQTPATEAIEYARHCEMFLKPNYSVTIVPGVGHAFSKPRGPQPLLGLTLGPVKTEFLKQFTEFAKKNLAN